MMYVLFSILGVLVANTWLTCQIFDQVLEIRLKVAENESNWTCNCECDDEFEDDGPDEPEREPAPVLKFVRN